MPHDYDLAPRYNIGCDARHYGHDDIHHHHAHQRPEGREGGGNIMINIRKCRKICGEKSDKREIIKTAKEHSENALNQSLPRVTESQ